MDLKCFKTNDIHGCCWLQSRSNRRTQLCWLTLKIVVGSSCLLHVACSNHSAASTTFDVPGPHRSACKSSGRRDIVNPRSLLPILKGASKNTADVFTKISQLQHLQPKSAFFFFLRCKLSRSPGSDLSLVDEGGSLGDQLGRPPFSCWAASQGMPSWAHVSHQPWAFEKTSTSTWKNCWPFFERRAEKSNEYWWITWSLDLTNPCLLFLVRSSPEIVRFHQNTACADWTFRWPHPWLEVHFPGRKYNELRSGSQMTFK